MASLVMFITLFLFQSCFQLSSSKPSVSPSSQAPSSFASSPSSSSLDDIPNSSPSSFASSPSSSSLDDIPNSSPSSFATSPLCSHLAVSLSSSPSTSWISPPQQSGNRPSFFSKKAIIIAAVSLATETSILLLAFVTFWSRYTHGGRRGRPCCTIAGGSSKYLRSATSLPMTKFLRRSVNRDVEAGLDKEVFYRRTPRLSYDLEAGLNDVVFYRSNLEASRKKYYSITSVVSSNSPSLSSLPWNTNQIHIVIIPAAFDLMAVVSTCNNLSLNQEVAAEPSDLIMSVSTDWTSSSSSAPPPLLSLVSEKKTPPPPQTDARKTLEAPPTPPLPDRCTHSAVNEYSPEPLLNKPLDYISKTGIQEVVSWSDRFMVEDKLDNGGDSFQNRGDMIGVSPTAHGAAGSSTSPPMVKLKPKPLLLWDKANVDSGRSMVWNKFENGYCGETNSNSSRMTTLILDQAKSQNTTIILMKSLEIPDEEHALNEGKRLSLEEAFEKLPIAEEQSNTILTFNDDPTQLPNVEHFLYHHLLKSIARAKVMLFRCNYDNEIPRGRESLQSTCNGGMLMKFQEVIPKARNKLTESALTCYSKFSIAYCKHKYSIRLVGGICMKLVYRLSLDVYVPYE